MLYKFKKSYKLKMMAAFSKIFYYQNVYQNSKNILEFF